MKSGTSFFNFPVYKKNLTRFFPLWLVYTIAVLLIFLSADMAPNVSRNMMHAMSPMALFSGGYGALSALCLFSDLFQSRRCNALHAMPLKRSCWYCTNILSGLTFALIPNLLLCLLLTMKYPPYWNYMMLAALGFTLEFMVFFGFTLFFIMLSGNTVAAVLLTGFVCLFSFLVYAIVNVIYVPLLWGVQTAGGDFLDFSPFVLVSGNYELPLEAGDGWTYLAIYTVVSALLMVGGWFLYKKRALECAGDFLAYPKTAPWLAALVTPLCGSLLFAFFWGVWGIRNYLYLFIGMVIVFFLLRMLLEGSLRVFRLKNIAYCAILCAVIGLSLFAMRFDPFGVEKYIPESDTVYSVTINGRNHYLFYNRRQKSSPELIEAVRTLHGEALAEKEDAMQSEKTVECWLDYTLENGNTVARRYFIPAKGEAAQHLKALTSTREYIFCGIDYRSIIADPRFTPRINGVEITREQALTLIAAIEADCDAGHLSQINQLYDYQGDWVCLSFEGLNDKYAAIESYLDLFVCNEAENTRNVLCTLNLDEFFAKCGVEG